MSEPAASPVVVLETSLGDITLELWTDKAPVSVRNFLDYVEGGHYDGTIFHRVIDGFMIQGGGFTEEMDQKPTGDQIKNEARADVGNKRGTLALARTNVVDSATCQFFINLKDNAFLNHRGKSPDAFGYCVFGAVTDGMDVVDRIRKVKTASRDGYDDVPVEPVTIRTAKKA